MSHPIETLMHEHRVIEQVLGALESFAAFTARGATAERSTVADFAAFFANFADRCHHGKEEDRLFVAMNEAGFPREVGPIAVMLHEHTLGREHVAALRAVGAGTGPLGDAERSALVAHAQGYVQLLRAHIFKEDTILFPMAAQRLEPEVIDRLGREFDDFEASVMGAGEHERYHALAEQLLAAHRPSAVAAPACGCHAVDGVR
jgi:hemerythrin-like domain-containing protein